MISVVIPLGPTEAWPGRLLSQLESSPRVKQIVLSCHQAYSGPNKPTDRIEFSRRGSNRAEQLNLGFSITHQDWIWFVHADTILNEDCFDCLRETIDSGRLGLYFFDLNFHDSKNWPMQITTLGVTLRSGVFKLPFGDQTFFVHRKTFSELRGFPEGLTYGEDHALVWQAHLTNIPVVRLRAAVATSARKYLERGWVNTTRDHLVKTVDQAWPFFLQYWAEGRNKQKN